MRLHAISRPALCVLLAGILLLAPAAFAQFESATVLGTVRDASQAVIPGATIVLESLDTGVVMRTTSGETGSFEFFNVRLGRYRVRAEKEGFRTAVAEEFTVTVNARQRVDLVLQVGTVAETVVVTDAVQPLETDTSDRGQVIGNRQIVNLPLNGRAYADLALLAPGVRQSKLAVDSTPRDASFNVNGLRSSLNNFVLDGVDNNAYGTSNQGFSNQVVQVSPDAVAEFKVQTNNYSAEFGRAGGAVINASIRSGSNSFHGSAWNYMRNTSLNAVGFFKPRENRKPTLIQNQFGATFGGPIQKDKAFIFMDYEGYRRVARQLVLSTIPTVAQRNGNLGVPVRNPLTGQEYANGVIPQSDMTNFARKVLSELPEPNRPGNSNNFEALPRNRDTIDKGDIRYDHYLNERTTAFVRYSHRLQNSLDAPPHPLMAAGVNADVRVLNYQIAAGTTYNMDPSSVLEVRLGLSQTEGGKDHLGAGGPSMRELYGITGLPETGYITGGLNTQSVTGYSPAWGRRSSNPQFQNPFIVNPKLNYAKVAGRHSLKAGYEFQRINTEIEDFHPKYGQDNYGSRFSRPAGSTSSNNLYNLADFMFGLRQSYSLVNIVILDYRQRMHFVYLQDDFKLSSKLTLNIGTRYEYATPQFEAQHRISNFDPVAQKLITATGGSLANRALVHPDRNNLAPRVGLAYTVTPRTVVRSGFGMSYVHFHRMGGENILGFNLPHVINPNISQNITQPRCVAGMAPNTCFRPTQDGYPEGFLDLKNVSTATSRTNHIPADSRTAYTASWHFTIQRELFKDLLFDVAYVGNRTNKLPILGDLNQAAFNAPGANRTVDQRRPIAGFSQIQIAFPAGWANYHALQTRVERRFTRGLYFLNSFTWSKAMDNASGHLEAFNGDHSRVMNYYNLPGEKGVSSYDQTLLNTTTLVWDLPVGRGRFLGANLSGAANFVLGGWRLTTITRLASGQPINLSYSPVSRQQVGGVGAYRPNIVGDPKTSGGDWFNWLNPAAVQIIPSDVSNPFGNAGRNSVRGPAFYQTDLGLHKSFPLPKEGMALEFRGEFFNLFNTTNFDVPQSNRSNNAFGQIDRTFPPRQVQLALKLVF